MEWFVGKKGFGSQTATGAPVEREVVIRVNGTLTLDSKNLYSENWPS